VRTSANNVYFQSQGFALALVWFPLSFENKEPPAIFIASLVQFH